MKTFYLITRLSTVEPANRRGSLERRQTRIELLRESITALDHGDCVKHTTLRICLKAVEMRTYLEQVQTLLTVPNAQEKRSLRRYNELLRQADAKLAAAQKLPAFGPNALKRERLLWTGRNLYCEAQDWILEPIRRNGKLNYLFDRVVSETEIADYPESMPRLASSTSEYRMDPRENHWYALLCSIQSESVRNSLEAMG